jgi:hypothetical protein
MVKLTVCLLLALAALAPPLSVLAGEDYYDILGIGREADNREIRKAFKKLALKVGLFFYVVHVRFFTKIKEERINIFLISVQYHPDKSKEPDAQEKFVKINKVRKMRFLSRRQSGYIKHINVTFFA